jgi:hypothetical protein
LIGIGIEVLVLGEHRLFAIRDNPIAQRRSRMVQGVESAMSETGIVDRVTDGRSVYEQADQEVQVHKWIESEKAGRDLGQEAVKNWSRSHWLRFYRWRLVQHLRGEVYFREFHPRTFAVLCHQPKVPTQLLEEILNQVRDGGENLDIICWIHNRHLPAAPIMEVLEAIDINRQRLLPPIESA